MNKVFLNLILFFVIQFTTVSAQTQVYMIRGNNIIPNLTYIDDLGQKKYIKRTCLGSIDVKLQEATYIFIFYKDKDIYTDYNPIEVDNNHEQLYLKFNDEERS